MRVIITGTRSFANYALLKEKLDQLLKNCQEVEIVTGGDGGTDRLGEKYARENGFDVKQFFTDWTNGTKANHSRNKQMCEYATHCVIFWDGKSKNTKSMIDAAREFKLTMKVVQYESLSRFLPVIPFKSS